MKRISWLGALRLVTLTSAISTVSGTDESSACRGISGCGDCVTTPSCAWCIRIEEDGPNSYCDDWATVTSQCSRYVYPTHDYRVLRDEDLAERTETREAVQVKPQEVFLELPPGRPVRFRVEYKRAKDVPVDLYYLMDLSNSMRDDKHKLSSLADSMAEKMKNITKEFRIGFGSFVEKVTFPFVNTYAFDTVKEYRDLERPYCFRNHMPLDTDTRRFKTEVDASRISANIDNPEAGLDALLQAVVCQEEIGWRNDSTKILVFSTDNKYHRAGDGKLAGIILPNSGECRLDRKGFYTECLNRDYPSISQIRNSVRSREINVIFAVTGNVSDAYRQLASQLEGSTVAELSIDSSNIVQLIQEQYNAITSTVKLTSNSSDPVNVTVFASCFRGPNSGSDECRNVPVGTGVTFEVEVSVVSCPEDESRWNQTFVLSPVGVEAAVTVHLRMICQCDCEKPWSREEESERCTGRGTLECGVCRCQPGRAGRKCECDEGDYFSANNSACLDARKEKCSGRGDCICGQCKCHPREDPREKIGGEFCQCDNFSCNRHNNSICGGHGVCQCGRCVCNPGWTGDSCHCTDSLDFCLDNVTGAVCGGRGTCECGKCQCRRTPDEYYFGPLCQMCSICPESCNLYQFCVQCKIFDTGPLSLAECDNCTGTYRRLRANDTTDDAKRCAFKDRDDCRVYFYYKLDEDDSLVIAVNPVKECPRPINPLPVVLGLIGGIVGTGLVALLVWKLITYVHDTREFAKFTRELERAKWSTDENPLFVGATSTFYNPTFQNDS